MTLYQIHIDPLGESYATAANQTLLQGMERLARRGIPVGCRGGGCGVCKVRIDKGEYRCKKMSRAHISVEEERQGYVLACRCQPLSDIRLSVVGAMKNKLYGDRNQ